MTTKTEPAPFPELLRAPFPPGSVKWRPGSFKKDKTAALALAYVDARDVMERLDSAFGPGGWHDQYLVLEPKAVECTITAVGVSKTDVGYSNAPDGDTESEPLKAAYSDAFKRAAVKWGIGRELYDMPQFWIEIDAYKRFVTQPVYIDGVWSVVRGGAIARVEVPSPVAEGPILAQLGTSPITTGQREELLLKAKAIGLTEGQIKGALLLGAGAKTTRELTFDKYTSLMEKLNDNGFIESVLEIKSVGTPS